MASVTGWRVLIPSCKTGAGMLLISSCPMVVRLSSVAAMCSRWSTCLLMVKAPSIFPSLLRCVVVAGPTVLLACCCHCKMLCQSLVDNVESLSIRLLRPQLQIGCCDHSSLMERHYCHRALFLAAGVVVSIFQSCKCIEKCVLHQVRNSGNTCSQERKKDRCHCVVSHNLTHSSHWLMLDL